MYLHPQKPQKPAVKADQAPLKPPFIGPGTFKEAWPFPISYCSEKRGSESESGVGEVLCTFRGLPPLKSLLGTVSSVWRGDRLCVSAKTLPCAEALTRTPLRPSVWPKGLPHDESCLHLQAIPEQLTTKPLVVGLLILRQFSPKLRTLCPTKCCAFPEANCSLEGTDKDPKGGSMSPDSSEMPELHHLRPVALMLHPSRISRCRILAMLLTSSMPRKRREVWCCSQNCRKLSAQHENGKLPKKSEPRPKKQSKVAFGIRLVQPSKFSRHPISHVQRIIS